MKKLSLVLIATGAAVGAMAQIPVGVDLGLFLPTNSDVKEVFGKSWFRIGVTPLSFQKPGNWRFTFDLGFLKRSNDLFVPEGKGGGTVLRNDVTLIPLTFGFTRSFSDSTDFMPYVAVRVGPYYARVNSDSFGVDKSGFGINANTALGISFSQRFYIEARYDWYSKFEGINFSGISFSAGVKLFEIRL
ncbi:MAG: outer membrane beta-barrel protein [Fimbriimonadales bacterium]